jgi:hypothetical protein
MKSFHVFFAVVLAAFLMSPALSGRLDPNGYEGGRSRDVQQRAIRNSSAVATMLGEFRTAMSDIMYMKTERYLDNGIAFMPHLKKEILSASGSADSTDEDHEDAHGHDAHAEHDHAEHDHAEYDHAEHDHAEHDHEGEHDDGAGTKTMIPTEAEDFRGVIGRLQREVKPWRDPSLPHQHADATEMLPWFRLMTRCDPHYVVGYTVGGWALKSHNLEAAIQFAQEGIEHNADSFQIHLTLGQLYFEKGRRVAGHGQLLTPSPDALVYLRKAAFTVCPHTSNPNWALPSVPPTPLSSRKISPGAATAKSTPAPAAVWPRSPNGTTVTKPGPWSSPRAI